MAVPKITVISFKRGTAAYVIPVNTSDVTKEKALKRTLVDAITASGGLTLVEADIGEPETITDLSVDDIRLAAPKDKLDIYANQWVDVAAAGAFNDFDTIAFAYLKEPFEVVDPTKSIE